VLELLDELFVSFLAAKVINVCVVKVDPLEVYVSEEVETPELESVDSAKVLLVTLGVHQISCVVTSPLLRVSVVVYNGSSQAFVEEAVPVVEAEDPVVDSTKELLETLNESVELAVVEASHQT